MHVSNEFVHAINGVPGRMYPRHAWDDDRFSAQKWISQSRPAPSWGDGATMRVNIRFDDEYRNGHNTFFITCDVRGPRGRDIGGGAAHDDIARIFPELGHLIPWHLCSTDGPMYYAANTVYLAGDRDHYGRRAGEPSTVVEVIQFASVPMRYRLERGLGPFLREVRGYDRDGQEAALEVLAVAHEARFGESYRFAPKYQFAGQKPLKWHECPFDTEEEAARFADSFINHSPAIYAMATAWSEGKARDLDAARRVAIWPDATDEELSAEPETLKAALAARLPALIAAFRADMKAAGLFWSPAECRAAE